jgi:hypothetical protein
MRLRHRISYRCTHLCTWSEQDHEPDAHVTETYL